MDGFVKAGAVLGTLLGIIICGMVSLSKNANRTGVAPPMDTIYVLQDSGMRMIVFPKGETPVVINLDSIAVHKTHKP